MNKNYDISWVSVNKFNGLIWDGISWALAVMSWSYKRHANNDPALQCIYALFDAQDLRERPYVKDNQILLKT